MQTLGCTHHAVLLGVIGLTRVRGELNLTSDNAIIVGSRFEACGPRLGYFLNARAAKQPMYPGGHRAAGELAPS
jgi:hypothetical protein